MTHETTNGQHDDMAIAATVQQRDRNDTGERLTLEELAEQTGVDLDELETETDDETDKP